MNLIKIGTIHSPYKEPGDAPRQGKDSEDLVSIEVFEDFKDGLIGLGEGFLIDIFYWADKSDRSVLISNRERFGDPRGVFSLRAPVRPNPILVNRCRILQIKGNTILVKGMDALDGSPLLDIKIAIRP